MFLLALCLLYISSTSVSANVISAGQYTPPSGLEQCGTLQVSISGLSIPAEQIAVNGITCTGTTTTFQAIPLPVEYLKDIVDVILSASTGRITCGEVEISYDTFYYFRLKRNPTAFEIAQAELLLGVSLGSVSLRANVNYLTDGSCLWIHQGSAGSPSDPNQGGGGSTDTGNQQNGEGATCFPGSAHVELHDGTRLAMREVHVGHQVHVGRSQYSSVFGWTHQDTRTTHMFVRLWMKDRKPLVLTSSHFVYLKNGRLVSAGEVKVGDQLVEGKTSLPLEVVHVDGVEDVGLFNPQTIHGDIVVEGVLVSTYTTAIPPKCAHALLSPLRAVFRGLLSMSGRLSSAFDLNGQV